MNMLTEKRIVTVARWAGRILSILLLWLIVVLAFGAVKHGPYIQPQQGTTIAAAHPTTEPDYPRETSLGIALFTILAGLVVAWKWEGLGSLLILGGFAAFTLVNGSRTFTFQPLCNPFYAFLITGLLFLYCWWRTRKTASWQEMRTSSL
jgi:hypothetical protein